MKITIEKKYKREIGSSGSHTRTEDEIERAARALWSM